jgi:RNA polymerase sigma-70 factor (ECF subfamily)
LSQAETLDPDLPLVKAMAAGEPRALEELYARRGPGLLAYLVGRLGDRPLAEEVLQDVMLAAWRGARTFRGESRVLTWLLSIARLRAISAYHQQGPAALPIESAEMGTGTHFENSREPDLEAFSRQAGLQQALASLPAEMRETLALVFTHGLSGPETAAVLGVAPGTVKSRLHRAMRLLRKQLQIED